MSGLWQDFRYAARALAKRPGVPAIMVLTLALAIGAATTIFSVVHGVLLRPLPYRDSNRIMAIFEVNTKGRPMRLADPNFDDFRDQSRSFQAIAKYRSGTASVSGGSQPTRTTMAAVSPDFLEGLRDSADPRPGFQRRRRETRRRPDRSRQRRLLEAASRIAAGPLAVPPED